ncbi:MAG: DUF1643 domain-containing protein [Candidatus Brocadiales bacterium]|nr:DUF1643 domain-containing protein [Candidatus Bathyanammoxibius sp.]
MKYLQMHAVFSKGRLYRYTLRRRLYKGNKTFLVIGLNPSTADGKEDDPTVRRCAGFAERLDYDILLMVNLFALRSTDPRKLRQAEFPVGPRNDAWILRVTRKAHKIVLAWGAGADWAPERSNQLLSLLAHHDLYCFGTTKSGAPKHPLYLRSDTPLQRYRNEFSQ